MKELKFIPCAERTLDGVYTYWLDFQKIILPEIEKEFTLVDDKRSKILSFSEYLLPLYSVECRKTISYQILHNDIKTHHTRYPKNAMKSHRYITHYKKFSLWLNDIGITNTFIPMTVDIDVLPVKEKSKKIIVFTNLYNGKAEVFERLRQSGVEFDYLSFGSLNGSSRVMNRTECLDCVSQYEIGVGVGRSAIEMLAMNMKVIVAGKEYGGTIVNDDDLQKHWDTNFNSTHKSSLDFEWDVERIKKAKEFDRNMFDMKKVAQKYIEFLNS
jgi:hypothetical protein